MLYTFSSEFYWDNREAIITRLYEDSVVNKDGFSVMGGHGLDASYLATFDIRAVLAFIDNAAKLDQRVIVHFRAATGNCIDLNGIHGWTAGKYRVFHNGILDRYFSEVARVDSLDIVDDIRNYGIKKAMERLLQDSFANVIIADVESGDFFVHRSKVGDFFMDDTETNFSTSIIGNINKEVNNYFQKKIINN